MSEEYSDTSDSARIAALQVGFAALLELVGRDHPEVHFRVIECLRQSGEIPDNAPYRRGFSELAEMVEGLSAQRSPTSEAVVENDEPSTTKN
ncbi:hypothetical protein [Carnimonas nigrificans]|uniref:hypothetical protein n=1 Tax=Carnimonas nigrificans TaxID=64323 RepID=UPI00046EC91E|nr:hypothetical protein [Carnimonas nigrificans]